MENSIQHSIQELADDLKRFNRNDVLVNFSDKEVFEVPIETTELVLKAEGELLQTFKKSQNIFRESGTSVFCLSKGILNWEWNGTTCVTPIFLCPASIKMDKVKKKFQISWANEEALLNPFLAFYFLKEFEFVWPEFNFSEPNWEDLQTVLSERGFNFQIENKNHFGNFHHHRFAILRELESLSTTNDLSPVLLSVFNHKSEITTTDFAFIPANLFPADNDQLHVFEQFSEDNLVVHGPPGTGKSQVLGNVLGKSLAMNFRALVVSEKRVALEVLKQKLESVGLHHFVFLQDGTTNAQNLLNHLKNTWQFLEAFVAKKEVKIAVAQLKKDGLQFKLDILSNTSLIGGVSYLTFQELAKHKKLEQIPYTSVAPSITEFLENKVELASLFSKKVNEVCTVIPRKLIQDESIFQLDTKINQLEKQWKSLSRNFEINTPLELQIAMKKASFAQLLSNEILQDYFKVFKPNSSEKKKFQSLSKKYFVLQKELEIAKSKDDHWKKTPSFSETEALINAKDTGSFFEKRKRNKLLKSYLKIDLISAETALQNHLDFLKTEANFREIEKKFTEIGVRNEAEIDWIKNLSKKLTLENYQIWAETDTKTNQLLADQNNELYNFYQNARTYFHLEENDSFERVFKLIRSSFSAFLAHRQSLLKMSASAYNLAGKSGSIQEMESLTLKSNWIRFVEQFPSFLDFDLEQIGISLEEIVDAESSESEALVQHIFAQQKQKFDALSDLLQIPSRKLTVEQKDKKTQLRKGRSLLVKEFGKTRSHPTIRELLESEAKEWIYTLLPIWMVNPAQVGDFFPLETELFDLALFDEATQIPLGSAIGSLQRARRALVLGDEHQMSPSSFFKAGDSEPIDLLHQTRFNWSKVMLKHHYRSEHPELIAFSNLHFYDNELIAYPNSVVDDEPASIHFVENGLYAEQENKMEAKSVAACISKALKKEDSLGIVAFSEKQLKCILSELSNAERQLLDEKIDLNQAFCRALENVQGEECHHLIISLGYGPDAEGKLNLNFGPLNRKSGRRRLNVLLSRAKRKIDFFTSIKAKDLSLSDNDSLNLLRQFFQQAESISNKKTIQFPMGLQIKSHKKNEQFTEVQFDNLLNTVTEANELLTLYRVLNQRGWKINFS